MSTSGKNRTTGATRLASRLTSATSAAQPQPTASLSRASCRLFVPLGAFTFWTVLPVM
jgi:hypothetical protein